MKRINSDTRNIGLITLLALALFLPFLGAVHLFDWDEINFAECAREMIVSGDYFKVQLNFQPFWEKPPFFIWLQVISMKIFGVTEFAARFPNVICGVITLNCLFFIGKRIYNEKFGWLWVMVYSGTLLSHFYFKTGIIDPWFNLFIFLAIYQLILHCSTDLNASKTKTAALAGVFLGLAVLTKGPAALLIVALTAGIYWTYQRFKVPVSFKHLLLFFATLMATGFSWFLLLFISGHSEIIQEFMVYQVRLFNTKDSGHGGFLLYHVVVLLMGCFPSSIFFIFSYQPTQTDTATPAQVKQWMKILFWVVLILFTIVKTKIVHYSSLCWFPLTYLAAYSIQKFINKEFVLSRLSIVIILLIALVLGTVFSLIPCIDYFKPWLQEPGRIQDVFALENIKASVHWQGWEWLIGVLFIVGIFYFSSKIRTRPALGFKGLYLTCILCIFLLSVSLVPKIEAYSQRAAIDFYKSIKDKDCYVETYGFKSYAYLFYSNKQPGANTRSLLNYVEKRRKQDLLSGENDPDLSFNRYSMDWMMVEPIDKPAYIVCKVSSEENMKDYRKNFKLLYRKNGFSFYQRLPGVEYP